MPRREGEREKDCEQKLRWLDPPPTAPTRSIMPVQLIRHNAEFVAMTSADKYCPPWSCEYGVVIDF